MKQELIQKLHASFEDHAHVQDGVEYWLARELQRLLGYARWENFEQAVNRARTACESAGYSVQDHFRDLTKMVGIGSESSRPINDLALTRYACYLIAQNGDPRKQEIAFAQTYFAVQTRKQELIEARIAEWERLRARDKLSLSQKELSGVLYETAGVSASLWGAVVLAGFAGKGKSFCTDLRPQTASPRSWQGALFYNTL